MTLGDELADILADILAAGGPLAWAWLVLLALALAGPLAVLPLARREDRGVYAAVPLLVVGFAWLGTVALVQWLRAAALAPLSAGAIRPPLAGTFPVVAELEVLSIAGLVLAVATSLGACAFAALSHDGTGGRALAASRVIAVAAPLVAAAWLMHAHSRAVLAAIVDSHGLPPEGAELHRLHRALEADAIGVVSLAAGAFAASLAALRWRARRRSAERRPWPVHGAVCLLAGVLAFAGTRAHASDAAQPLPAPPSPGWHPVLAQEPAVVPPHSAPLCTPTRFASVVEIGPATLRLDGRVVGPELLRLDLATMRRNWAILHPHPARPVFRVLLAPRDSVLPVRTAAIAQLVAEGGHPRPELLAQRLVSVRTETLGVLRLRRYCALPLTSLDW